MILLQPIWLILIIPLAAAWTIWKLPSRFLRALRLLIFVLAVLALCRLSVKLPIRGGLVVILADRSASMPPGSDSAEKEIVDIAQSSMRGGDRLAVVSFARRAALDRSPQAGKFAGFVTDVGRDQTDLNSALESALSLLGQEPCGRALVISDGRWTGNDRAGAASKFAARGLPVDYRLLQRSSVNDLAISSIQAPETVLPGQSYMISAMIDSPVGQDIRYEFKRGAQILASGTRAVASGTSRLTFRDRAPDAGTCQYTISIAGTGGNDPVPENNTARILVGVQGARPILVVSPAGANSALALALKSGGLNVSAVEPAACKWDLEDLAQYSAVVIENTLADNIGTRSMENIAAWVEHAGGGLMMTGGRNSYGPGGYFKSPLERIMPVSMELRREHRKLSLAIVVALDRSGSMALPAGGGKCKIDLADIGTVQVLDLLSPMDEFGAIAVDSIPHVIVPLDPVGTHPDAREKILRIDAGGGGIFIYDALAAACKMLASAQSQTRHIILFSDAADAEEPKQYKELVEKARAANITVSVVGLGSPNDCDADLLRDIARRGGGLCFFSANPDEIPRLFAQDTFSVARSTFIEEATQVELTGGLKTLTDISFGDPPPVGGYNLCYARTGVNPGAVTVDEYKAPIVASWYVGSGRTLCFAGEVEGKFTGAFGKWPEAGKLFASLAGWTAGRSGKLPDSVLLTQEVRDGLYTLELHLDPERKSDPFSGTPRAKFLRGEPGQTPTVETAVLNWKSADLLSADLLMNGGETLLTAVEIPGFDVVSLTPVCMPYSPEFKPDKEGRGGAALAQLAASTGGKERIDVAGIWKDLPKSSRYLDLTPGLILLALLLFLLEIFERRTGLIAMRRRPVVEAADSETKTASIFPRDWLKAIRRARPASPHPNVPAAKKDEKAPPEPSRKEPEGGTFAAMKQAKKKTDQRFGK